MRSTWNVEKKTGGSWSSDGTIYRPNANITLSKLSTQTKTRLANGDNAFMTPATKKSDEPLNFIWYADDGTMKNKVQTYIDNQSDIKIIDHNSTEYVGRFTSIDVSWVVGIEDEYDINCVFERMASLN